MKLVVLTICFMATQVLGVPTTERPTPCWCSTGCSDCNPWYTGGCIHKCKEDFGENWRNVDYYAWEHAKYEDMVEYQAGRKPMPTKGAVQATTTPASTYKPTPCWCSDGCTDCSPWYVGGCVSKCEEDFGKNWRDVDYEKWSNNWRDYADGKVPFPTKGAGAAQATTTPASTYKPTPCWCSGGCTHCNPFYKFGCEAKCEEDFGENWRNVDYEAWQNAKYEDMVEYQAGRKPYPTKAPVQ